jgi:serine/threonine protein kinase
MTVDFIHLDFKPENILVSPNAKVRLVDFDLAQPKPEEPKRMAGNPGTPAYMAPEHLQHEALDQRADIFSFRGHCLRSVDLRQTVPWRHARRNPA